MIKYLLILSATSYSDPSAHTPRVKAIYENELACRTEIARMIVENDQWYSEEGQYGLKNVAMQQNDSFEEVMFCVRDQLEIQKKPH